MKYVLIVMVGLFVGCGWQSAKSSCENQSYWPINVKACFQCADMNEFVPVIDCSKLNKENDFYTAGNISTVISQFYGQMLEHCYKVAPQCIPQSDEE